VFGALVFLQRNTTMSHRNLVLAAAALVALTPVISHASPERTALNSCARAFAASFASPGATVPAFKVNYRSNQASGSLLTFYTREYTFELYANDPKTGLPIGRASCATDSHGAVTELLPLRLPETLSAKQY
jgi:hypothetical protein